MKQDLVNQHVVSRIASIRVRKRITMAALAAGAGIPPGSISCLLTGQYRCSMGNLFRLLYHLEVSIQEVWPAEPAHYAGKKPELTDLIISQCIGVAKARLEPPISLDDILDAVCQVYGLTREQLATPSRKRYLTEARAVAAVLVKEQPHLTLVSLSMVFQRDVSTFFHCVKRMKERLKYDLGLADRLAAVMRLL